MKRMFCLLLVFFMVSVAAVADINIVVTDSTANRVRVSGDAREGDAVMLYVLNDGYTESDLIINSDGALQYAADMIAGSNGYEFNFDMYNVTGGDKYIAIIVNSNQKLTKEFPFYPDDMKSNFIISHKSGDFSVADVKSALTMFDINSFLTLSDQHYADVAKLLENIRDINGGFSLRSDSTADVDEFVRLVKQAVLLAAYNADKSEVFKNDGSILHADILKIDKLSEYGDYKNGLNSDGIKSVKAFLLSQTYNNPNSYVSSFKKSVYVNLITNNNMMGYAHVPVFLNKYSSAYESFGFNFAALNNLTYTQKNEVYKVVAASDVQSVEALASIFNQKIATLLSVSNNSSNHGASSPSMGTSVAPGYIIPEIPIKDNASIFTDVSDDFWGLQYIVDLVQAGVINGYDDGSFAPNNSITRAEFVKLLVTAFGFEYDAYTSEFDDVKSTWSAPYVGAAVENGIVYGVSDTQFAPDAYVSREEAATMIGRILKNDTYTNSIVFSDDDEISSFAKEHVYMLKSFGVIQGREDNKFEPKAQLTRAEAAKLVCVCSNVQ